MAHRDENPCEESLRSQVAQLSATLQEREAAVARLQNENQRLNLAIAALRDSRWQKLGDLLRQRPFGIAELRAVLTLGGGLARTRIAPADAGVTAVTHSPVVAAPPERAVAPYVVRLPQRAEGSRRRVVHVIANFMNGGSSRLVVDLVEGLGDRYDQRVLTSFVPNPVAFVGIPVKELRVEAPKEAFTGYFRDADAELVHMHYWGSTDEPWYRRAFEAISEIGCPVIENVNTPIAPLLSPRIARYVYVSDYVKEEFGGVSDAETVIYPGSNLRLFAPAGGPGDDGHTVGMVYRLERDKLDENSIEPLIDAVRRRPGTRALVVGGGSLLPEYRRRVSAAGFDGSFEFPGHVSYEDLPRYYERMTVFVAPVWQESFGQVSSFAMSMGIPIVGYAVGAIPEIVRDATLVAPFPDAHALGRLIVGMLDDPQRRAAVAARNREFVQAAFTVEAMVKRYERMYEELAPALA
jgi:glycosyltransferase involved in cell wall biosynthesis